MTWCVLLALPVISAMNVGDNLLLGNIPSLPTLQNLPGMTNMGGFNSLAVPSYNTMVEAEMPGRQVEEERIPCSCGVFLNGQFRRGSNERPRGNPALLQELTETFQCSAVGDRQCTNKCLETIMRHLPNSPIMVCGSIDRDCHKERAYLFVKNCRDKWINTNLSAGREYCCKDGVPYKCPPS